MPTHDALAALIDAARNGHLGRAEVYHRARALGLTPGASLLLARSVRAQPARRRSRAAA